MDDGWFLKIVIALSSNSPHPVEEIVGSASGAGGLVSPLGAQNLSCFFPSTKRGCEDGSVGRQYFRVILTHQPAAVAKRHGCA